MFQAASTMVNGENTQTLITEAIDTLREELKELPIIGLTVYASPKYNQDEITAIAAEKLGSEIPIVGASTAGEIAQNGPSSTPAITMMMFASNTIKCHATVVTDVTGNELVAGEALANQLLDQTEEPLELVIIHSDGLTVNPSAVLRGIKKALPGTPVVGGSAGDDGQYKSTYQYCNGETYSSAVVAMAFTGPIKFAIGVRHGWSPISGFRTVTRSEGSVVHEIDHQPAIKLYEEFIGEAEVAKLTEVTLAEIALSYPIGMMSTETHNLLLRAPFYVDKNGSITFGGEVPEGTKVQLMMGNKDQAVDAAEEAGISAAKELGDKPIAALIYSCHVRDSLYQSRDESKKEISAIQKSIGVDTPLTGFFTYAEQAPILGTNATLKTCDSETYNETIVTVLMSEKTEN